MTMLCPVCYAIQQFKSNSHILGFFFRHRVSESSESTSTTNSTTTPSATPEIPLNMSSNDQDYHPGDYDNDNADSPTWRGILRKTNSKINLND